MCRCLLVIVLVMLSNHGFTQSPSSQRSWQFIGRFDNGTVQYIDMKSLRKERGYIRVRTLEDHKIPEWWANSEKILSSVTDQYIDCNNKRFAILSSEGYECHMARCIPKETFAVPFEKSEFKKITNIGLEVGEISSEVGGLYALVCQ